MLLTKTVKKKWNPANKIYYESRGYKFTKFGNEFEIKTNDLPEGDRKTKIVMECINPNCSHTKTVSYATYIDRLRGDKPYLCTDCFRNGDRVEDFFHKNKDTKCQIDLCDNSEYENGMCRKHYYQKLNLNKILKPLQNPCNICNSEINVQYFSELNTYLCRRHRLQYQRNGFFQKRTIYDSNKIIYYDDYAEMELYDLVGNVIATTQFDLEDIDKVKKYKWHLNDNGYVITCIDSINLRMHKLILGQYNENYKGHDYDNMTDHKDRNKKNNRKYNLRIVDDSTNKQNRDLLINNKTGRTGLMYTEHNKNKPWKVQLMVDGTRIIDKSFKSKRDAEYILDLNILYYKKYAPEYNELKLKYINIYDDLIKNGIDKYIKEIN